MWIPPLLVIPLLVYNAVSFDLVGGQGLGWASPVVSFDMPSGAVWSLNVGDVLVLFALALLMLEGLRTRRTTGASFFSLFGSVVLFAVYAGEFLLLPAASTSLFFTCLAMSFVDVITRTVFSTRNRHRHRSYYED